MFDKKKVLIKVLIFGLTLILTTDSLFVSIGDYPNHIKYGINVPECGLRYIAEPIIISRSPNCFNKSSGNISITFISFPKVDQVSSRVFNGRDAKVGESPWTVRLEILYVKIIFGLQNLDKIRCTGSLITFEWVLTAAHCVDIPNILGIEVLAGSKNWKNSAQNLKQIYINPIYVKFNATNSTSEKNIHDIALIKLKYKYSNNFRDRVHYFLNTICLPNVTKLNENEEHATFAGWGITDVSGTFPIRLQIGETVLKPNTLCKTGFVCAQVIDMQPKTCFGDSGGPLSQLSDEEIPRAIQIGVLHAGEGRCKPGNATMDWNPPMRFIDWILDTIGNNTN